MPSRDHPSTPTIPTRRHHRPFSAPRSAAEYRLIVTVLGLLRRLSLERASSLMAKLIAAGGMATPRWRQVGLANLAHAFPEKAPAWHAATLRGSFQSLGRLAAEVAHFPSLHAENIRRFVGFSTSEAEIAWQKCMAGGAALIATGHFGNWELFAQAQGLMGRPINVVHRPLRNPRLDDLLTEIRARAGTGAIYKHAAARAVLRLLHQGALVAIPIDQHSPGASGVPIQFFGRPANTTLGPARLAQLTGVPLYVAVLARVGESTRHEIVVRPPVEPPPRGKDVGQLIATMQRVTSEFEVIVRERPEQWLWMHRRWRGP